MSRIQHTDENCVKCQCPDCDVQAKSQCTLEKRGDWDKMINEIKMDPPNDPPTDPPATMTQPMTSQQSSMQTKTTPQMAPMHEMVPPGVMIGLYCSADVGTSSCGDLDKSQNCSCWSCDVFKDNSLKAGRYCTEGDADKRG